METLTRPDAASNSTEPEINLLLDVDYVGDRARWRTAALVSAGLHFVLILTLAVLPGSSATPPEPVVVRRFTPLYIPTDFTQKAPNTGKIQKELMAEAIAPRPVIKAPVPKAAPPKAVAPTQVLPLQPPPAPQPAPQG